MIVWYRCVSLWNLRCLDFPSICQLSTINHSQWNMQKSITDIHEECLDLTLFDSSFPLKRQNLPKGAWTTSGTLLTPCNQHLCLRPLGFQKVFNDEWSKEEARKTGTKIKKKQDHVHLACRTQFVDLHSRNYKKNHKWPKSTIECHELPSRFVGLYSRNDQKVPVTFGNYHKIPKNTR